MKINEVYVINLQSRPDRWNEINDNFKDTGLHLQRWNAVNGKDISEEHVKNIRPLFAILYVLME